MLKLVHGYIPTGRRNIGRLRKDEQTNAQRNGTSLRMAYNLLQMKKKYVERSGLESSESREADGWLSGTKKCNNFLTKWATISYFSSSITLLNKMS